jgi:L-amino acid N-acyltransferase YncA
MQIRRATEDDAARVAEFYNCYIRHTIITLVGVLKNVGYKFGRYIDVGIW